MANWRELVFLDNMNVPDEIIHRLDDKSVPLDPAWIMSKLRENDDLFALMDRRAPSVSLELGNDLRNMEFLDVNRERLKMLLERLRDNLVLKRKERVAEAVN